MDIKDLLDKLSQDKNLNQLAIAYAIEKDGEVPSRQDKYRSTVEKILNNPANSKYRSVHLMFKALGVDIEAAIAIAATQKIKQIEDES